MPFRCSIKIGSISRQGDNPMIAISAFGESTESFISEMERAGSNRELYEIRYDLFSRRSGADLEKLLEYLGDSGFSYIFTFRSDIPEEIAAYYGTASRMGAPAADIEYSFVSALPESAEFPVRIVSHHFFDGGSVIEKYKEISRLDPDIVKVASTYRTYDDFYRDLSWLVNEKQREHRCVSFMPMGRNSQFLRVLSAHRVSDLVYAKLDGATAEGQLSKNQYLTLLSLL